MKHSKGFVPQLPFVTKWKLIHVNNFVCLTRPKFSQCVVVGSSFLHFCCHFKYWEGLFSVLSLCKLLFWSIQCNSRNAFKYFQLILLSMNPVLAMHKQIISISSVTRYDLNWDLLRGSVSYILLSRRIKPMALPWLLTGQCSQNCMLLFSNV